MEKTKFLVLQIADSYGLYICTAHIEHEGNLDALNSSPTLVGHGDSIKLEYLKYHGIDTDIELPNVDEYTINKKIAKQLDLPLLDCGCIRNCKCHKRKNRIKIGEYVGSFMGCANAAYRITQEQKEQLIFRNNQIKSEKEAKEKAEEINILQERIKRVESYENLPKTKKEASALATEYNEVFNEGGYGYVPYFYSLEELDELKKELTELLA